MPSPFFSWLGTASHLGNVFVSKSVKVAGGDEGEAGGEMTD